MSTDTSRRTFLKQIGLGLPALAGSVYARDADAAAAKTRPNVVLIMTDQQHAGMLSCAGNPCLKTPHMDGLARAGARFERAYCANPVCMPSRFTMLSGVMPSRIGIDQNGRQKNPVPDSIVSHAMGTVFRAAGYETVYGGKRHLPGRTRPDTIADYGFDKPLTGDSRDKLAEACAAFLQAKHDRPFLLVASFINPHDICYMAIDDYERLQGRRVPNTIERQRLAEALELPKGMSREAFFGGACPPLPPNYEIPELEPEGVEKTDWRGFRPNARYHWTPERWRLHRWAYARLTERVDAEIGRVLKALRDSGLEENTLVVLTSDHGDMDSAHRLEHKSMLYEEAARIPFIVSWRGVTRPGLVDAQHLVSSGLDLIPTLCDFAGVPIPSELKGRSVRAAAEGRAPKDWRETLVVENEGSRLVRWGNMKYGVYASGARRELLIDLAQDPGEMKNRAADPQYRSPLETGRRLLARWYDENGEKLSKVYRVRE
jgi:choline-sulfatase